MWTLTLFKEELTVRNPSLIVVLSLLSVNSYGGESVMERVDRARSSAHFGVSDHTPVMSGVRRDHI